MAHFRRGENGKSRQHPVRVFLQYSHQGAGSAYRSAHNLSELGKQERAEARPSAATQRVDQLEALQRVRRLRLLACEFLDEC